MGQAGCKVQGLAQLEDLGHQRLQQRGADVTTTYESKRAAVGQAVGAGRALPRGLDCVTNSRLTLHEPLIQVSVSSPARLCVPSDSLAGQWQAPVNFCTWWCGIPEPVTEQLQL